MTTAYGPILVVEDVETVANLLKVQLTLRGYNVLTARDGHSALDLVETTTPALIVSDILMPRMDGFTLAHRLRTNPRTAHIPIIFLSATYISGEDERFALTLGAMRFLPKPVDGDQLAEAVAEALNAPPLSDDKPPLTDREFYIGYRQRLKNKLQQKRQQMARHQHSLKHAPADQREVYQHLLTEAQHQAEEIERELETLSRALQE